jgi:sugar phosphate permease
MHTFYRWLLLFSLIVLGSVVLLLTGVTSDILESDKSMLSAVIYSLFLFFSIRCGFHTYQLNKSCQQDIKTKQQLTCNAITDFKDLGLIGTVIGILYMLGPTFAGMQSADIGSLQKAMVGMGTGMATALYTTASGLICSLLLKWQLINLESGYDTF